MTRSVNQPNLSAQQRAGRNLFKLTGLVIGLASFFVVLVWSGVVAFQRPTEPVALAATQRNAQPQRLGDRPAPKITMPMQVKTYEEVGVASKTRTSSDSAPAQSISKTESTYLSQHGSAPAGVKHDRSGNVIMVNGKPWTGAVFDHRPIQPVKTRTMKTTAYSPDEKSCGKWADGITASGKSVWMNGGRLVAADRAVPYGTILTIPGYNDGKPVQVWDRGGKIKGNRLDLLYPTHEIALQWGVQDLRVVFWEFVESD